ncbi:MAG: hypothetical protein AAF108_06375 [Planctomycetota bacterium]
MTNTQATSRPQSNNQHAKPTALGSLSWLHRIRLKALGVALGFAFAALGLLSLWTLPAWSIVGVAVAAVAVAVNTAGRNLGKDSCLNCGQDLAGQPRDTYGTVCKNCGAVQTTTFARLAHFDSGRDATQSLASDTNGDTPANA